MKLPSQDPQPPQFASTSGRLCFLVAQEEFVAVRDLLGLLNTGVGAELERLIGERNSLASGERLIHPELGDTTEDVVVGYDDVHIPHVRWVQSSLAKGAALLLVFALTERVLRIICEDYGLQLVQKQSRTSTIDHLLQVLSSSSGWTFTVPREFEPVRTSARYARNRFAHGEWDLAYEMYLDPTVLLGGVAALLRVLEDAATHSERPQDPPRADH